MVIWKVFFFNPEFESIAKPSFGSRTVFNADLETVFLNRGIQIHTKPVCFQSLSGVNAANNLPKLTFPAWIF